MKIPFNKTVLAIVLASVSSASLAAGVSAQGKTQSEMSGSLTTNNTQSEMAANNRNQVKASLNVDTQAVSKVKANTESSVNKGVALGNHVRGEAESAATNNTASMENTTSAASSGELIVNTVDGIAIDLSADGEAASHNAVNASVEDAITASVESAESIQAEVEGTTQGIIDNTLNTVDSLAGAISADVDIESETNAAIDSATQQEMDSMGEEVAADMESENSGSAAGNLTGSLF